MHKICNKVCSEDEKMFLHVNQILPKLLDYQVFRALGSLKNPKICEILRENEIIKYPIDIY